LSILHSNLFPSFPPSLSKKGGDQGILNDFFSNWSTTHDARLPFVFNVVSTAFYSYRPAFQRYKPDIKVFHFIGQNKPWLSRFDPPTTPNYEMKQLWWKYYDYYVTAGVGGISFSCHFLSPIHLFSPNLSRRLVPSRALPSPLSPLPFHLRPPRSQKSTLSILRSRAFTSASRPGSSTSRASRTRSRTPSPSHQTTTPLSLKAHTPRQAGRGPLHPLFSPRPLRPLRLLSRPWLGSRSRLSRWPPSPPTLVRTAGLVSLLASIIFFIFLLILIFLFFSSFFLGVKAGDARVHEGLCGPSFLLQAGTPLQVHQLPCWLVWCLVHPTKCVSFTKHKTRRAH